MSNDYAFLKMLASPDAHDEDIKELLQDVGLGDERYTTVLDGLMRSLQGILGLLLDCEHSGDNSLKELAAAVSVCETAQRAGVTGPCEDAARGLADAVWTVIARHEFQWDRKLTFETLVTLFRLTRGTDTFDGFFCDTVGGCKYAPRARVLKWDGDRANGLEGEPV